VNRPELIDEHEASRCLGIAVATLRRWRWAGKGPRFCKIGRSVRYELIDIQAFVVAARRQSTSDPGPEAGDQSAQLVARSVS
jgi:predicted DNA-binding transcriptional regulator AlpA